MTSAAPYAPAVHVGIVSWNVADLLCRCLDTLPAALDGLPTRVVVVDNASSDESVAVARARPGIEVIANETNVGYARAMNQALAGADAPILVALNPDTELTPGSLARLAERLDSQPDVGLVAPRLVNADLRTQHSAYRFPSPAVAAVVSFVPRRLLRHGIGRRWWLEGFAPHDEPNDVDWAIGAVHVIRAAATKAVDGGTPYSERWFMYVEDLDLCWRLDRAGWRTRLEGDIEVLHVGNASGAQAWGSARTARWLEATYDWYRQVHGRVGVAAWGLTNIAGFLWLLAARTCTSVLPVPNRRRDRAELRVLAGTLPLHVRFILGAVRS